MLKTAIRKLQERYEAASNLPTNRPLQPEDFPVEPYVEDSHRLFAQHEECGGDFIWSTSADSSKHTARLPMRGVGGLSRICCNRPRWHVVSLTSILLFMPIPPLGGHLYPHQYGYR